MSEIPAAPAAKREKKPEFRVRDAVAAITSRGIAQRARRLLSMKDPLTDANAGLSMVERRCKAEIAEARAARDFAREIAGLSPLHLAQVAGALDVIDPPPDKPGTQVSAD